MDSEFVDPQDPFLWSNLSAELLASIKKRIEVIPGRYLMLLDDSYTLNGRVAGGLEVLSQKQIIIPEFSKFQAELVGEHASHPGRRQDVFQDFREFAAFLVELLCSEKRGVIVLDVELSKFYTSGFTVLSLNMLGFFMSQFADKSMLEIIRRRLKAEEVKIMILSREPYALAIGEFFSYLDLSEFEICPDNQRFSKEGLPDAQILSFPLELESIIIKHLILSGNGSPNIPVQEQ